MAFLKFRGSSTTPTKPTSTTAASTPLTNAEIDGNFASLNDTKLEIGTNSTTFATGDIIYASATNTLSKLSAGVNGYLLTLSSGLPVWQAAPVSLPTQTGNSGKLLTTDGTTASWTTAANTDTTQVVRTDKFLQSPYQLIAPRGLLYRGTGALTSLGTISNGTSSLPQGITVDPTGRFVYIVNFGTDTIGQWSINQTTGASPAQVPQTGLPLATKAMSGSSSPQRCAISPCAVDSPPGSTSALQRASSAAVRTSTAATPSAAKLDMCSRKSP